MINLISKLGSGWNKTSYEQFVVYQVCVDCSLNLVEIDTAPYYPGYVVITLTI